jgi:hypothetical protein
VVVKISVPAVARISSLTDTFPESSHPLAKPGLLDVDVWLKADTKVLTKKAAKSGLVDAKKGDISNVD